MDSYPIRIDINNRAGDNRAGFISISLRLASNNSAKLSLMLYSNSVVLVVGRLSLTLDSLLRAPAATVLLLNSTARHLCW